MPHVAATVVRTTNTNPMARPESVLLLQPWSTAISQTMNSVIAILATAVIKTISLLILPVDWNNLRTTSLEACKPLGAFAAVRILSYPQCL